MKTKQTIPCELRIPKLYKAWHSMIDRCDNPKNKWYMRYGGRGIVVCDEWKKYVSFAIWSLNNGYEEGLSIDRKDNDGNYSPTNCRWVSIKTQQNNRCSNRLITINGETKTVSEWADKYDINYNTVLQRMKYGMNPVTALTTVHKYRGYGIPVRCIETGETFSSARVAAETYGVSLGAIAKAARSRRKSCGVTWEQIYDEIPEKKRCTSYRKIGADIEK